MRLIDADILPEISLFGTTEYINVKKAPTVQAIPLAKVKQASEEIDELDGEFLTIYDGTNKLGSGKYVFIDDVLEILDKLIAESE